jgi:hypothetical protein
MSFRTVILHNIFSTDFIFSCFKSWTAHVQVKTKI